MVILGDSNVSKITESTERDIQLESYPGAKIRNLEQMMIHPAETDGTHPEIVILSVGINDRANKPGVTTIPNLRRMAVRAGFPYIGKDYTDWSVIMNLEFTSATYTPLPVH